MQDTAGAIAIVVGGKQVGVAVQCHSGFCFVATRPGFDLLDGSRFWRIEAVQEAACRLWEATLPNGALRPVQPRRHMTVVPFRPARKPNFDWCAVSGWKV